jgi:hypothetical protein
MQSFSNIEKHHSIRGMYLGYTCGSVYRITKDGNLWNARMSSRFNSDLPSSLLAKTLIEMSAKLESVAVEIMTQKVVSNA